MCRVIRAHHRNKSDVPADFFGFIPKLRGSILGRLKSWWPLNLLTYADELLAFKF
jgi:hypothetical protein